MVPILDGKTLELITHSQAQTQGLGRHLARLLRGGEVLGLEGDLGTGKTSLVQGIAWGLGVEGPVTSPTFTLIQEYPISRGPVRRLYHVDLYRLEHPVEEVLGIGLDEILGAPGTVTAIEWAERIEALLPEDRVWVRLAFVDHAKRVIRIRGHGRRGEELVRELRRALVGGIGS
ncbi:MAG: tRNA (adenosine(37)-N6)-threonylcarbamoyltransferase complex ATPase subunit type 1 TsaE [Anaerolineae bacterium]